MKFLGAGFYCAMALVQTAFAAMMWDQVFEWREMRADYTPEVLRQAAVSAHITLPSSGVFSAVEVTLVAPLMWTIAGYKAWKSERDN